MAVLTKITQRSLADNAVTSAHVQGDVIAVGDIAAGAVGSSELAADAVIAGKVADGAIDVAAALGSNVVTQAKVADDAIGADELASNAVVNASVAAGAAIAVGKLAGTASRVLETSGTGAVQASAVTAATLAFVDPTSSVQTQLNAKDATMEKLSGDIQLQQLRWAIQENKIAYATEDSFVDQFENKDNLASLTNTTYRPTGLGEYVSTAAWSAQGRTSFTRPGADKAGYAKAIDKTDSRFGTSCYNGQVNVGSPANDTYIYSGNFNGHESNTSEKLTVEWWFKNQTDGAGITTSAERMVHFSTIVSTSGVAPQMSWGYNDRLQMNTYGSMHSANQNVNWIMPIPSEDESWHHFCWQRYSNNTALMWVDGQKIHSGGQSYYSGILPGSGSQHYIGIGYRTGNSSEMYQGKIDEFRFSKGINRYGNPGNYAGDFDPPTAPFVADANTVCLIHFDEDPPQDWSRVQTISSYNATGSFTNTTNTVTGSRSTVSITVLYKNAGSTVATLNTHLVAEVSANGGTNWTTCVLAASAGTVTTNRSHLLGSQSTLAATAKNVVVTAGTDIRYRISFAGQSSSQYTEVHGVALMY